MMRPFPVLASIPLLFALGACATEAPTQARFDEGTAAYDAGDYGKAYRIFRELADDDDIAALRNVALMERKGQGTDKDPQAAIDDYLEAARAGLPTAQADLGEMYLDGEAGPPDPKAALPWLQSAAAANHPIAQYHLGQLYEQGEVVPKDMKMAEQLYAAAAAHGVQAAVARLSELKGFPAPGTPESPSGASAKPSAPAHPDH